MSNNRDVDYENEERLKIAAKFGGEKYVPQDITEEKRALDDAKKKKFLGSLKRHK